jgi:hypothetical protein
MIIDFNYWILLIIIYCFREYYDLIVLLINDLIFFMVNDVIMIIDEFIINDVIMINDVMIIYVIDYYRYDDMID